MSGIYYYAPRRSTITREQVLDLELGYAADEGGPTFVGTSRGPDGGPGVFFTFCESPMNKFEAVRWSRMPKSEVWVGYDPEHPPTPQDLMRREQMHGHWVKLADGREWLVPVVRAVSGVSPLPRKLTWDGSAWSAGEVKDHYKDLFAEACLFWDAMTGSDAGEITISDEADTAVRALAVNYRIGPAEISALGLFDTRCHGEVILAMVDWPMVAALAKKKAAEERSLPPGGEG